MGAATPKKAMWYSGRYGIVPAAVVESEAWASLTSGTRCVYVSLAVHANHEGVCFPSAVTIMKQSGLATRESVYRAIDKLVKVRLVERVETRRGPGRSSRYRLVMPLITDALVSSSKAQTTDDTVSTSKPRRRAKRATTDAVVSNSTDAAVSTNTDVAVTLTTNGNIRNKTSSPTKSNSKKHGEGKSERIGGESENLRSDLSDSVSIDKERRGARLRCVAMANKLWGRDGDARHPSGSTQYLSDRTCSEAWFDDRIWPDDDEDIDACKARAARFLALIPEASRRIKPMAWLTTRINRGALLKDDPAIEPQAPATFTDKAARQEGGDDE